MMRGGRVSELSERGGGVSSFLHAQLMANKAPEFSGEEEDWITFSHQWSNFLEVLKATEGREIEDVVWFGILESCVDDATKSKIQSERRKDHRLSFSRFWQGLEREFGRDQESAKRSEWERVHLKPGEITLASWRSYRIAFEAGLSQLQGITDREIEKKVVQDLPPNLREKLVREIASKAQDKLWAKVMKPCVLNKHELTVFLGSALEEGPPKVEERTHDFLIECKTEEVQTSILELEGWEVRDGEYLRMCWTTRRPNWQDIVKWVEKTLRVDQEIRPIVTEIRNVNMVQSPAESRNTYAGAINSGKNARSYRGGGKGQGKGYTRPMSPGRVGAAKGGAPEVPKVWTPNVSPRFNPSGNTQVEVGGNTGKGSQPTTPRSGEGVVGGTVQRGPNVCYACQRANRPCEHPYWECNVWWETRWGEGKGNNNSVKPVGPQEDALSQKGGKGQGKGDGKGKGKGKGGHGRGGAPPHKHRRVGGMRERPLTKSSSRECPRWGGGHVWHVQWQLGRLIQHGTYI